MLKVKTLQTKDPNGLPFFSKKHLFLVLVLLAEAFMVSNWHVLQASSEEEKGGRRRLARNKCTGQYYYEKEKDFDANDVKEIITLLANNEQFNNDTFNDLENEDLYRVRAYFRNTDFCVGMKDFSKNDFEVSSTEKSLLGLGQIQFTIKFKVHGEPIHKPYTLMLLIDDKQELPSFFDIEDKSDAPHAFAPPAERKRAFSFGNIVSQLTKSPSPRTPRKKAKEKEIETGRSRAAISPPRQYEKTPSTQEMVSTSPKGKRERSLSSRFKKRKQTIDHSPSIGRNQGCRVDQPEKFRRSKSIPNLRSKRIEPTPISERKVPDLIEEFEAKKNR